MRFSLPLCQLMTSLVDRFQRKKKKRWIGEGKSQQSWYYHLGHRYGRSVVIDVKGDLDYIGDLGGVVYLVQNQVKIQMTLLHLMFVDQIESQLVDRYEGLSSIRFELQGGVVVPWRGRVGKEVDE